VNDLAVGTTIEGYHIEQRLGTGGMGSLYRARDGQGNLVVLKFPHASLIGDPTLFERYQRELAIGRILRHPRVQHVLATGEYEGNTFMVTEYVEGESLRTYLDTHAPLPIPEALHLLDELCQGVAYCHEQGVFHRDLKPENIVITAEGDPVIIDFGIALLSGARRITWNGLNGTVGTPDYMAPEQIQGKRGDARTDIYALGAMGYEFLTGQPPYTGDNPLAVMSQHLYSSPRPLRELAPAIPASLDAVILKSLQRDPDARYQTVEEFRQAILHHETTTVSLPPPSATKSRMAPRVRQRLRTIFIVGAIIVGIILLGVVAQILHGKP
jgi:eukaryotic-like serine/threonine-protein kinase